ncbi:hypothetical protein E1B28_002244 [Marasmius oreades]|uniref:Uncharacterized protein n=1 Tax=Marasmius oreades TaxID=181124 RepID=A0A9P7RMM4_9AGAR|nr:uncharacterized protein E1B28_002244 [Marasmius oreades]KAG7086280.1 hypothetical protein E1B28_002244 [Marasmius oreades]
MTSRNIRTIRNSAISRKPEQSTSTGRLKPKHGKAVENLTSAASHEWSPEPYVDKERAINFELSTAAMELCKEVMNVYNSIDGNPADGRWTAISNLLKPPCTRGKHGVWFLPPHETREPKGNMELVVERAGTLSSPRFVQVKEKLKEKVEKWQMEVVVEAEAKASPRTPQALTKGQVTKKKSAETSVTPQVGATDPSSLGFCAQKSLPLQLKAKQKSNQPDGKQPEQSSNAPRSSETTSERLKSRRKAITDIPENDFLPPSFSSSQIQHSTPFRKPKSLRRPPSPIPLVDMSTPSIHTVPPWTSSPSTDGLSTSPIPTDTRDGTLKPKLSSLKPTTANLGLSCSLPAFGSPKTPGTSSNLLSRKFEQSSSTHGAAPAPLVLSSKRSSPRSLQGSRPFKKRRIEPDDDQADVAMNAPPSPLVAPQKDGKDQLPTLTELLESARKSASPKGKRKWYGTGRLDVRVMDKNADANQEDLAKTKMITKVTSASGPSPQSQAPSNKIETQRTTATSTTIQGRQPGWEDLLVQSEDPYSLPIPEYSPAIDFTSGYGFDITVPPKSMSSIGSDSEKEAVALLNEQGPDRASLPRSSANHPVLVPDSPALPDFTYDPEAFAPQMASTQQKDVGGGDGGNVRGDVFLNSGAREGTDDGFMLPASPPQKQKNSPVRGATARFSSMPISQSPSGTPSKSQSQLPFEYSSQMDLEGGVDQVSRFLEKDISMVDVEEEDVDTYEAGKDRLSMGNKGWVY